jgi:hypothetical protein
MNASPQLISDEAFVRDMARILGPGSASFRAISDLTERRAQGDTVSLVVVGSKLLVLPNDTVAAAFSPDVAESAFCKVRICGAPTRSGRSCRQPSMANGHFRIHGGEQNEQVKVVEKHLEQVISATGDAVLAG